MASNPPPTTINFPPTTNNPAPAERRGSYANFPPTERRGSHVRRGSTATRRDSHAMLPVTRIFSTPSQINPAEAELAIDLDPEQRAGGLQDVKLKDTVVLEHKINHDPENKLDPLNWTPRRKMIILAVICYMTFMTDFLASYGVPMHVPQAKEWGISTLDSGRSLSGNTFMQGFGSLFAVPFAERYGRMPVMFWSTFLTLLSTIACAVCPHWIAFIAIRVIQGFFSTAAQVLGLSIIHDIFFFEQHARMVGIWGWSLLIGPYFGPFLGSFMLKAMNWREAYWACAGFVAFGLVLILLFLEETYYDRENMSNNPVRPEQKWKARLFEIIGVLGHRTKGVPTIWQGVSQLFIVIRRPEFALLFIYHGISYMWSVGINGTLILFLIPAKPEGYGFDTVAVALIYFAPMTGIVVGELWGHWFNDYLTLRSLRRRKSNVHCPESRLTAIYFASIPITIGLIVLGFALQQRWHYMAVAVSWGTYILGAMASTVAISAYALDVFPKQASAASALLNFTRVLFGFMVNYFQVPWAKKMGANVSFGTQSAITVMALAIFVIPVHIYGQKWRSNRADNCESPAESVETSAAPSLVNEKQR